MSSVGQHSLCGAASMENAIVSDGLSHKRSNVGRTLENIFILPSKHLTQ